MKYLRNPELRRTLLPFALLLAVATAAAGLWNPLFGLFTFVLCALFLSVYLASTCRRYKRIADLASGIDRILHGNSGILLEDCAEGELGILQSEISKMTVRLREQQQRLQEDKVYLANSIADISHQIRTPLTSINLILQFLSEPDIPKERRRVLICELYELLSRIDWLITTLLKISKLDAGTVKFKREEISLEKLISGATAPLLVPMELREQTLAVHAEGELICDGAWTCEALTNIVKNCMEHTPRGGDIRIDACENALYSEIVVSDSGKGIDKTDLPHIFERFYKGKNSDEKSFGIGLALTRMIVVGQNGTIKAENSKTGGALFTLRFYKGAV